MGARDYWDRMLVYFGIAEEVDVDAEADADRRAAPSARSSRDRDAARRERDHHAHAEWDEPAAPAPARRSPPPRRAPARSSGPVRQNSSGVGVVPPRTFNDAQTIADHFKGGLPVIVNLQQTDADLAKRLIDFASGLTYGLDGDITRIADKVFLLTPPNVDVTAEERAAMVESGFFNQS
jgi:cell division inhibitor SepF